ELAPDPRGAVMHEPVSIDIAGAPVARRPDVVLPGAGRAVAVEVGHTITDVSHGDSYARVAPGASARVFSAGTDEAITAWSGVGDCNRYDEVSIADAGLRADAVTTADGLAAVRLEAQRHSACVSAPVGNARPGDVIRVAVAQRAVRGSPPRTCLWLAGRKDCATLDWSVTPHGDWYEMSAVTRVPANAGAVR